MEQLLNNLIEKTLGIPMDIEWSLKSTEVLVDFDKLKEVVEKAFALGKLSAINN